MPRQHQRQHFQVVGVVIEEHHGARAAEQGKTHGMHQG
jgi:hypothetical protein